MFELNDLLLALHFSLLKFANFQVEITVHVFFPSPHKLMHFPQASRFLLMIARLEGQNLDGKGVDKHNVKRRFAIFLSKKQQTIGVKNFAFFGF